MSRVAVKAWWCAVVAALGVAFVLALHGRDVSADVAGAAACGAEPRCPDGPGTGR